MTRFEDMNKAEQLLDELSSWSEDDLEELPLLYRKKAREYRRLTNPPDE